MNQLPSSAPQDLETAAFADRTQVIALGNGDTFGPEYAHGVRHQIERVVEVDRLRLPEHVAAARAAATFGLSTRHDSQTTR